MASSSRSLWDRNQSPSTVLSSQKHKPKQKIRRKKQQPSLKLRGFTAPQVADPLQFVKNTRLFLVRHSAILGLNLIVAVLHQVTSSAWVLIHSYKPTELISHNCLAALKRVLIAHSTAHVCLQLTQV